MSAKLKITVFSHLPNRGNLSFTLAAPLLMLLIYFVILNG